MVMIEAQNNKGITPFQAKLLAAARSSRFGCPRLNINLQGHEIFSQQPLTDLAIATIINPSIERSGDSDPGGAWHPNISINYTTQDITRPDSDSQRKWRKGQQFDETCADIMNLMVYEGLPFSTPLMEAGRPNPLGIGNIDTRDFPERIASERGHAPIVDLESQRTDMLLRNKLLIMGNSSSGKSSLARHLRSVAAKLSKGDQIATLDKGENHQNLLLENRPVNHFDATTSEKFMRSLLSLTLRKKQLLLVELPATIPVGDIPNNLRRKLENSLKGGLFSNPQKQLRRMLDSFQPDDYLFSTVQVDAITSDIEKARGIITPIAQDDISQQELLEDFLLNLNLDHAYSLNGVFNASLNGNKTHLNNNLMQIFNNLPAVLKNIFAFGILNQQEVMPLLLPLNQKFGEFKKNIAQYDIAELHQLLILLRSVPRGSAIEKTNLQLASIICAKEFNAESLARHAIALCPDASQISEKLIDLYDFAETLSQLGVNTAASRMSNTLYHSIITLVSLAHQTNVIDFKGTILPDIY